MKNFMDNSRLWVFTLLAYGISWACWLPIIMDIDGNLFQSSASTLVLFFLGAYGPTIAAVVLTWYFDGRAGLAALMKKLILWRVGLRWIALALLVGPGIYALSTAIYSLLGGELGQINLGLLPWIPVVVVVSIVLGPLAEELGWRGFALPCLDTKNHFVASSILIGIIWAIWHAPLFWAETGTAVSGLPITIFSVGLFLLAVIGSSFIYTWMFRHTSGSVLIAVILHLSMNASGTTTAMLFPDIGTESKQTMYLVYVAVIWMLIFIAGAVRFCQKRVAEKRSLRAALD
ncbi:CPBP family intramembrane glutamic endopeptidase [Marinimicrobium sp. ABcell2]|uniref:CPBP family intramembrane glutamic endopeptidase n=1 Tax=Marinimicrobium sp. ABcell2 TaxID=3069751 RepID=UPI0027B17FC9|nr:type II CAAX endopeptidase family protein [Marinimicrobium sp. ABcell2]MDQ2077015.1 type II CAAX endopeptidase family protein [Marinimicrobium sp. ABcell2]